MVVGLAGDELTVRVGSDLPDEALATRTRGRFDMTARPVKGWILVAPGALGHQGELAGLMAEGVVFARSLPPEG